MPDTVIAIAKIGKKGVKYSLFSTAFASSRLKAHAAREITSAPYGWLQSKRQLVPNWESAITEKNRESNLF
jgi:hypothetical protein